jgi:alkylation response protein AidB-like acyl-CoA dehydrogenase
MRQADEGNPAYFGGLIRAKYLANKTVLDVAQLGVRAGGASGYLMTSTIQRHLRDAEAGQQLMAYYRRSPPGSAGRSSASPES